MEILYSVGCLVVYSVFQHIHIGWRHSMWWHSSGRVHTNCPLSSRVYLLPFIASTWGTRQLCHREGMYGDQLWTNSQTHSSSDFSFIPGPDPAPNGSVEVHIKRPGAATRGLLLPILCSQLCSFTAPQWSRLLILSCTHGSAVLTHMACVCTCWYVTMWSLLCVYNSYLYTWYAIIMIIIMTHVVIYCRLGMQSDAHGWITCIACWVDHTQFYCAPYATTLDGGGGI